MFCHFLTKIFCRKKIHKISIKMPFFFFSSSFHSFILPISPVILVLQMPSEIPWSAVFLLLVDCATILFWFFLDNAKKRRRPHKNEIFICGDCWLLVFDFLTPSQLGLEIALVSRRFDCIVDEHFKTRKWTLGEMRICHKIEENGTKQMQIVNSDGKELPIPQNPLPNKVIGFRGITIAYIDHNVVAFLRRFHRLFAVCSVDLDITTGNDFILEFVLRNIWPLFPNSIMRLLLNSIAFRRLRHLDPSMLNYYPFRSVFFNDEILLAFPPDDSANASDGQAVTKWLLTPRPDGVPKWLKCFVNAPVDQWSAMMEQLKAAFSNASSPIRFKIYFWIRPSFPIDSVVPFELINELTGEQLTLEQKGNVFLLSRCPIAWDVKKWKKYRKNKNVIFEIDRIMSFQRSFFSRIEWSATAAEMNE